MSVSINTWTATSGIHFKFSTIFAESDDFLNYFGFRNTSKSSKLWNSKQLWSKSWISCCPKLRHFAIKIVSVITRFHYVCKIWNGIWTSGRERIWNVELQGFYEYFQIFFYFNAHKLFYGTTFLWNFEYSWIINAPNDLKSDLFLSN